MPIQVICNCHKDLIKIKHSMVWIRSYTGWAVGGGGGAKGQVTPKSISRSGWNSNLFEILCLFRLSASLIKIHLKLNRLCSDKIKIRYFSALKGKLLQSEESHLDRIKTPARFYGCPGYLQVWRWFDQKWRRHPPDNISPIISLWELSARHYRASNSEVISLIWPK